MYKGTKQQFLVCFKVHHKEFVLTCVIGWQHHIIELLVRCILDWEEHLSSSIVTSTPLMKHMPLACVMVYVMVIRHLKSVHLSVLSNLLQLGPPQWRRGSGLNCGSRDQGWIPCIPSPRVGPLMARRLKMSSRHPGARVRVGSARLTPLAAHGIGCPAAGQNLETGQLARHNIAEISLNVTLDHSQPTNYFN